MWLSISILVLGHLLHAINSQVLYILVRDGQSIPGSKNLVLCVGSLEAGETITCTANTCSERNTRFVGRARERGGREAVQYREYRN